MRTASGLVMIPVTPGAGASPKATDTVTKTGPDHRPGCSALSALRRTCS